MCRTHRFRLVGDRADVLAVDRKNKNNQKLFRGTFEGESPDIYICSSICSYPDTTQLWH